MAFQQVGGRKTQAAVVEGLEQQEGIVEALEVKDDQGDSAYDRLLQVTKRGQRIA